MSGFVSEGKTKDLAELRIDLEKYKATLAIALQLLYQDEWCVAYSSLLNVE
jgi:hypothetical protein